MKKTVNILWVAIFVSSALVWPLLAAEPWEILSQSPGAIESATQGAAGDVCILERVRFTHLNPATSERVLRELPMAERVFLSPGGNIYASIIYEGQKDMANASQLIIYSVDGRKMWSIYHHPANDVYPLDSGGAIAVIRNINAPIGGVESNVFFFSPNGELLKQVSIPAPGEVKASPSSDRILINSGIEGAILFDSAGEELARLGSVYRMSLSQDGRWVAILYGPKMSLYHEGQPIYVGELGGEIVRGASFAPDNRLVAAFTDHAFFLLKNPGGQVILQRRLDLDGEFSYTSIDLTLNASCIAVGVERDLGSNIKGPERHPEGKVLLYNRDGRVCYQMSESYSRWNTTTPRVRFSPSGDQLMVLTRDEVMRAPLGALCVKGGER